MIYRARVQVSTGYGMCMRTHNPERLVKIILHERRLMNLGVTRWSAKALLENSVRAGKK